ncbi:MAG: gliding motility-associated C-terminal domain-containing protein [Bacteroidetes bacterium]|nr:MAG: gliding motility-associated C-terminal domain-containing protein [Bacteroidota bacterium]
MLRFRILICTIFLCLVHQSLAIDAVGGHITWSCSNTGRFLFRLTLYRECSGQNLSTNQENIRVWNHPDVTDIQVTFVSREVISPSCTPVGSDTMLNCNAGSVGAMEKIIYQSDPMDLLGTPPSEGWVFTYETTARRPGINNLVDSELSGMTLVSKMFEITTVQTSCLDASPKLMNNPVLQACAGRPFQLMMDLGDADLDSVSVRPVSAWKNFPTGFYEDGVVPAPVNYASGFSLSEPTPGTGMNGSNVPFSLNAEFGDFSFQSADPGAYVIKLEVSSYRNGKRNASVEMEFTVFVLSCEFANNPPQVDGPFSGSFEIDVNANTPVSFTLQSSDLEFLQDGSPQDNIMTASGVMFGTDFTSVSGCPKQPCATLTQTPPVSGSQGGSLSFDWQTSCEHLKNTHGNEFEKQTYNFVFRVQDDVCPVPASTYQRIRVTVRTQIDLEPAKIQCLEVLDNGDLKLSWSQAVDPGGNFVRYELHSTQNGLLQTVNDINTVNHTFTPSGSGDSYFVKTYSGDPCAISISSDTVRPMILDVIKSASNGVAQLKWNTPFEAAGGHTGNYLILREYPAGLWTEVGRTSYLQTQFFDTIDICSATINYLILYTELACPHISSKAGDDFTDETPPTSKPVIQYVSIDTITGNPMLSWNQISDSDTYGYIVYFGGQSTEIDTAIGISNTNYTYTQSEDRDSLIFSIAAIDSCLTPGKTSPESNRHQTVFLNGEYDLCGRNVVLQWTAYKGWDLIRDYQIFFQEDGGPWQMAGTAKFRNFTMALEERKNYRFVVETRDSLSSNTSFSNSFYVYAKSPTKPGEHYTRAVTVEDGVLVVKHMIEQVSGVTGLQLERLDEEQGEFIYIGDFLYSGSQVSYEDEEADPSEKPYTYRVRLVDSCGRPNDVANEVTSVHLSIDTDHLRMTNYLTWTPYEGYNGKVLRYHVFRGIEGNYGSLPQATLNSDEFYYQDTLFETIQYNGEICYYVVAEEAMNVYGFRELARSNEICVIMEPRVYIPNTFSPNEDGINEVFLPVVYKLVVDDYELAILDRWGQRIFRSKDLAIGWDGSLENGMKCQDGIYQYVMKFKDGGGQEVIRRGFVNLSR